MPIDLHCTAMGNSLDAAVPLCTEEIEEMRAELFRLPAADIRRRLLVTIDQQNMEANVLRRLLYDTRKEIDQLRRDAELDA